MAAFWAVNNQFQKFIDSRNSSKNMPRFSSNDMVHNHYIDEAKKKTQERDRNLTTSVTLSARFQSTTNDSKPKHRSNNQTPTSFPVSKSSYVTITDVPKADHSKSSSSFSDSKNFVYFTCHKCVFNANHDACITKLLKEIFTGHRFSPNKTSDVYEKTSPRYDLRWKPTGRIFKSVGLRWIPTGKLFDSCISKVDSEPPHGSNVDILNIYECKQNLDFKPRTTISTKVPTEDMIVMTSMLEPSAVTTTDASDKSQQQPDSTSSASTLATTVTGDGNFDVSYALSWKPCQGDSLNLPDHRFRRRCCSLPSVESDSYNHMLILKAFQSQYSKSRLAQVDQGSQIKMIHVKEMMQDNDLKNSKSKHKGSKSRSQSMNDQSHYKQDKTKTRQSINVKSHIFNVIGGTEEFEERDLNIGGDC
ncbi:hypothetical protein Tco_0226717 [Tanacetum coccineum]